MVCAVLALHRVSPRCFNLSGLRPTSVRDQLLRSTLIVRSLFDEKLILPKDKDRGLLIYGGGVAGINAAMEAARHGVQVTVLEKSDTRAPPSEPDGTRWLFSAFAQCTSRTINATEYDWPHESWRDGTFLESPLRQANPTYAYVQCTAWRDTWQLFAANENGKGDVGEVTLIDNQDASHFRVVHGPDAELSVSGPWPSDGQPHATPRTFGALVSCVGVGSEILALKGSSFSGPAFWSDDAYLFANMPLPDGVTSIVISGGGDGGMQDLQRAATSYCGGELFERLESLLEPDEKMDYRLRAELLAADEAGRRAHAWAGTKEARLAVAERWHRSIEERVHAFFKRRWHAATFERLGVGLLREQLLNGRLSIRWVVRDVTPGAAYVLNRFLVLVLVELSKRAPRRYIHDEYACEIRDIVRADGSHPNGSAQLAIGDTYTVKIGPSADKRAAARPVIANLILIRHGVEPAPPVLNGVAPVSDQMLPLGWP